MANQSTMQPFAKGDIFAGATLLNRQDDDHAGDGRIFQYDSNLNEKGVLWTEGTTHLVGGLAFGPDGAHLYLGNGNTTCYQVEFKTWSKTKQVEDLQLQNQLKETQIQARNIQIALTLALADPAARSAGSRPRTPGTAQRA